MQSCIGLFLGLLVSISVSAEPLIEGRVRLSSGQPAVGVHVRLFDLTKLHQSVATTTDETGYFTLSLPASSSGSARPQGFALGHNYPNPFNPSTIIPYQIPTAAHVRLEVFNILGQRVATLVDADRPAGFHAAQWDATDAAGRAVGAGVYIYRLVSGGATLSRRMVLIDGQAGSPAASATGPMPTSASAHSQADARVYGLTVSGAGVVAYVDPAFHIAADSGPVKLVVETLDSGPRAKAMAVGILGDVDNNERVDFFDALLVALYSGDASIVLPNNGDISLGDVNADGQVDLTDAYIIAAYLNDPSDPSLPAGIGQAVGSGGETSPSSVIPPSPSNVRYEWDSSIAQNRISWDPSPGATSYRVYYDDADALYVGNVSCPGGCDLIGTVTDTSLGHSSSAARKGYWVRACNDAGCSNYVAAISGITGGAPPSPSNVRYEWDSSISQNRISWDPSPGATSYRVYYDGAAFLAPSCPGGCDLIGTVTDTSLGHFSHAIRKGYWVRACNDEGCSNYVRASYFDSGDSGDGETDTDAGPGAPANVSYVREGSSIRITWDAVSGAEYYKIYHDDFHSSSCRLNSRGRPSFCEELASNIQATSYVHTSPDDDDNYYWVVACNSDGCSTIDSENPATFIDTRPGAPTNVSYVREGSSIRITWDAVSEAEYYKIYHDDFFEDNCRLNSRGRPSFCEELASNIQATSYVHTNPDDDDNYYWVVACNNSGCSDIDSENPAGSRSQN